jgi:hypothetical protein
VAASLCGIESLRSLDRDFLKLSDLSDEFLSFRLLMGQLVCPPFGGLLELLVNLVSDSFVLCLFCRHHLPCLVLATVNLFNQCLPLFVIFLHVAATFFIPKLTFNFHFDDKGMVFLLLALLGENSFLSGQLHLDFLLLNVLKTLNVVALVHLTPPPVEIASVFKPHRHLI